MVTELGLDLVALNDFETGGLDERACDIIGYGTIIVEPFTLQVVREFEMKAQPEREVTEGARLVNGYTPEAWADALTQREAFDTYCVFLDDVHQFASWNSWFDRRFLRETELRLGARAPLDYHCVDLVGMFREHTWARNVRLKKFSLDEAAATFHIEREELPHRPLQGARKALEVWRALRAA